MATVSLFPTNSIGASWSRDYDTSTGEGGKKCSVSNNTITFRGDGSGSSQGYIYSNYLAQVNLSNYSSITISISSGSVWALGYICLVVQSSSSATASATKSVKLIDETKIYHTSTSINVNDLSGDYYIGLYCRLNSYSSSEHNPTGKITCSISLVEANYTVTLDKGAGISAVSPKESNSVTPGNSLDIDATVSSGYVWSKWTGDTDYLTSAVTTKANTVKPSKNITLKATATGNTYYVKYNKNGSYVGKTDKDVGGTMSDSTCIYGTAKNLTAIAYSLTGYSFNGWNTKSDGTGTNYANEALVSGLTTTSGATVNLYAKWKANTYTVVYNANGGSGTMSDVTHTYDSAKSLTKNTFTKEGYMFMGWSTSSSGDVEYTDGESVKNLVTSGTVNLYAVWVRKGTVRIMVGGVYKMAQIYVYSGGWRLTQPHCYSGGWRLCGG